MQKGLCGKAVSHTQLTLLCKEKTEHFSQYHPKNKTELKEVVGVVGGFPRLSKAELCNTPMWDLRQPNAFKKSMEKGSGLVSECSIQCKTYMGQMPLLPDPDMHWQVLGRRGKGLLCGLETPCPLVLPPAWSDKYTGTN